MNEKCALRVLSLARASYPTNLEENYAPPSLLGEKYQQRGLNAPFFFFNAVIHTILTPIYVLL